MTFQHSEYLCKILLVVRLADFRDLIKFIYNYLLVFFKEFDNVVVVIIERVAVYLCFCTKIRDSDD